MKKIKIKTTKIKNNCIAKMKVMNKIQCIKIYKNYVCVVIYK